MPTTERYLGSIQRLTDKVHEHPNLVSIEIVEDPMDKVAFASVGYPAGTYTNAGLIDESKMRQLISILQKTEIDTLIFSNNEFTTGALQSLFAFLKTDSCKIKNFLVDVDMYSLRGKIPQILDAVKTSGIINLKLVSTAIQGYRICREDLTALEDLLQKCHENLKEITLENIQCDKGYSFFRSKHFAKIDALYKSGLSLPKLITNHETYNKRDASCSEAKSIVTSP
jgi:hypothetical protein